MMGRGYEVFGNAMRKRLGALKRRIRVWRERRAIRKTTAEFWNSQNLEPSVYWTEIPWIRQHVNTLVTDVAWIFPLTGLKIGWAYRPLERGLSIGCGTGALERNVRLLRVCDAIDGIDVSADSIREARRLAKEERLDSIRYRVGDCDTIRLPRNRYDIVFFHGSLHHIADPDRILGEVERALKPHGLLYVDDYVGPSRDEWTEEHLVHAKEVWETIPEELRLQPVAAPLDWRDPSEMIRSSAIRPAVLDRFDLLQEKPYWGNLLFPLICALRGAELMKPAQEPLVRSLIERETELVRSGVYSEPLFTVMLARKRRSEQGGSE
jgi:SAM-dependent methyltransferase